MKILFLTQTTPDGPASRVRGYQMAEALAQLGCRTEVSPGIGPKGYPWAFSSKAFLPAKTALYLKALFKRLFQNRFFNQYDLIYIQKEIFPHFYPIIERILFYRNIPYVFDFDDAIHLRRIGYNGVPKIIQGASGVTVGNAFLEKYAQPFQKPTLNLPSSVQLQPQKKISKQKDTVLLGWLGSASSWKHFHMIWPALKNVLKQNPKVRLKIMTHALPSFVKNTDCFTQVIFSPWSLELEKAFFQSVDIGLAPLMPSLWSEGKCGYKCLQYMSYGLPIIATPIGVQKTFVSNGVNGFLAESVQDWEEALKLLIQSPALWTKMGEISRHKVQNHYTFDIQAPRLKQFFETILKT